jgi:hypothetical protein
LGLVRLDLATTQSPLTRPRTIPVHKPTQTRFSAILTSTFCYI